VAENELKRGRPKQLTRESIVEAAAQFRQSELNLSNLAHALDVTPQSLYHYFPSIKAIDLAVADFVAESVPLPDPDLCWQDYLRQTLILFRDWVVENDYPVVRGYQAHGLSAFRVSGRPSESLLRRLDAFLAVFLRDGFELEQAMTIWIMLQNYTRRSDFHAASQEDLDKTMRDLKSDIQAIGKERFEHLVGVMKMEHPQIDDLHQGIVDRMIAGLEAVYGIK
jgi:AcrR family transcriptional regulator